MCRSKNTVNILSKNFIVFAISSLAFYLLGWGLMFGNGNGFVGLEGIFAIGGADNSPAMGDAYAGAYKAIAWTGIPLNAKFFFQLVFAGTAATIVSGSVAERIKYKSFIVFSFLLVAFVYPITGHWIWGGGFLASGGFFDFAGSTVVHSVGGWAALAGILVLGPRLGKYGSDGRVNSIPPHSYTSAVIGCFVLWLGWFGFNPGSTMAVDANAISHIFMTTNTAGIMALLSATAMSWMWDGKPSLGMSINGCLAGLVAITAPCAFVTVPVSLLIGLLAGIVVVCAVKLLDNLKIDDPVGAISVHGVNGVWGVLSVGIFATGEYGAGWNGVVREGFVKAYGSDGVRGLLYGDFSQFTMQVIDAAVVVVFGFVMAYVWFKISNLITPLRVSREIEVEGLDGPEMGVLGYPDFQLHPSSAGQIMK
jgi:Amt family ammonium transporter